MCTFSLSISSYSRIEVRAFTNTPSVTPQGEMSDVPTAADTLVPQLLVLRVVLRPAFVWDADIELGSGRRLNGACLACVRRVGR